MMRSTLEAKHKEMLTKITDPDEEINYLLDVVNLIDAYTNEEIQSSDDKRNMNGFFEITGKQNRGELYNQYINKVENKQLDTPQMLDTNYCEKCNVSLLNLSNEATLICPNCGYSQLYFESGTQCMSYDQEINSEINISFAYKRINHFNELLAQFQAKETTNIPQEVILNLREELRKSRVRNKTEITQSKVKTFLKKLGYNKFYEHVPHITNILNGIKPPTMNMELEETLRSMFRDIQEPFEKNKPKERSNFLSYNYCLYKFCELLGHDEFLPSFNLLKSREKLYNQDVIWKKICADMNWQYIPTV